MTHDEKVLALLSDGGPHTHHELYALNVIAHSRVSSLRGKGHVIESWRDGDDYLYRLVSLRESSAAVVGRSCADDFLSGGRQLPDSSPPGGQATVAAQQLSVWDALAA